MKKIKYLLSALLTFFIGVLSTNAADITTYISGANAVNPKEEFTVTIGINGASNIYGLSAAFSYDAEKLELINSTGESGFNLTLGSNLIVDTNQGLSGNFAIATLTFKAKESFVVGQSASINISNVEAGDGANVFSGTNASLNVTMQKPKSTNNFLSSLSLDKGNIKFNKNTTNYSLVVANNVTSINISATSEDSSAKVEGTGKKNLNVYANTFYVNVTSESGAKKSYVITINRQDSKGNTYKLSDENALSALVIEGYDLKFNKDVYEYKLEVEENVDALKVEATSISDKAKVEVDNPEKLVVGENKIVIKVTSESGEVRTYTVKVFKKEALDAPIITCPDVEKQAPCSHGAFITAIVVETIALIALIGYVIYDKEFKK